ncbi:MAG: PKD domain-containing protein [Saprospiraceae bacterium]
MNDVPTSDFTSDVNGADVDFTNNSTNADSYSWDFGDGNSSTEVDPSHTYTEDGVYTVVLTSTNECGSTTSTMTVTIVTPPVAGFSADAIEGCLPFTVNFTNESSENATDFSWEFEGGDPATSTDENPSSTWNAAGTYTVTLTASNGAGSSTSTITITVNDVPTSDFTSDVNGADVDFTNNSTNADSYSWDFGDGNSSTEVDPSHTYTEDGVYTVVLTSTNECGSTTSTMTVTIVTPPVAGFSADAIEGCLPFTVNFTNESSENATDFSWEFEGGDPATSTDENPSSTWNAAGTYTVVLTASNSAGSSTSTITITVNDVPTVDFTTQLAGLTLVTTNNSMNADTYEWNFGDGSLSGAFAPTHTYDAPGSYEVTLTATNECGSSTTTSTVEITGSAPLPGFTSESQVGCVPFVVNFMDTSEGDPISWKWSFPGGDPATSTDQTQR